MSQTMVPFRYERPDVEKGKKIVWLCKTDRLFGTIQVINKGGESNLHSHAHLDGFWYVLKGKVRFYSDEKTVAAELNPGEGVLIPRGVKYWFESAGEEPLEILQIECSDKPFPTMRELMTDRTDFTPATNTVKTEHLESVKL